MSVLDQMRLDGRVALVTGAGSGLGRTTALAVAEVGAAAGCVDVDGTAAAATAATIVASGGRATAAAADVADPDQADAAVRQVATALGPVDILFNFAGVRAAGQPLHEVAVAEWRRRLGINLDSVYLMCRAVLPGMIERRSGRIINVSSIWGNLGSRTRPITEYAAAKGAIVNLTREMALQYAGSGILVNAIAPGFFITNLNPGYADPAWVDAVAATVPLRRCAGPEEIAGLAVFLAAPASGYVTGQTIVIDGGFSIY